MLFIKEFYNICFSKYNFIHSIQDSSKTIITFKRFLINIKIQSFEKFHNINQTNEKKFPTIYGLKRKG